MEKIEHVVEAIRWSGIGKGVRWLLETTSIAAIITTVFGWVPVVIALLPGLYYGILIYEKVTGKKLADRRKKPRK